MKIQSLAALKKYDFYYRLSVKNSNVAKIGGNTFLPYRKSCYTAEDYDTYLSRWNFVS